MRRPGPPPPDPARLLRRLRRDRGPEPAGPPPPRGVAVDEILAAISGRFRAGDMVGPDDVVALIDVTRDQAERAERWARFYGAWPYLSPPRAGGPESDRSTTQARPDDGRGGPPR